MRLTAADHALIEASVADGLVAYINRLRTRHAPDFGPGGTSATADQRIYRGCVCGDVFCHLPQLITHIDDLRLAYEMKVEDLARETRLTSSQ